MDARVEDRVAIVTGGSRGIGQAIAEELLDSGARGVVITSRRSDNVEHAVDAIGQATNATDRIHGVVARADDPEHASATVGAAIERFGSCDILVNNAGTNPSAGALADVDLGAVDKTWSVNLRGPLLWAREAWNQWMGEHGGVIVNTASVGGLDPGPALGAYNVSKAGLIFMTRQLAYEMAPTVRVNAVAPAVVKTRLSEMLWSSDESAAASMHPIGRLGEPTDVANAVVFLCSDKASWITGITLPVDGGMSGATASGIG